MASERGQGRADHGQAAWPGIVGGGLEDVIASLGPVHTMETSRQGPSNDPDTDRQHAGDTLKQGVQGAPAGPGGPVPASLSAGGPAGGRQHLQPCTQLHGVPPSRGLPQPAVEARLRPPGYLPPPLPGAPSGHPRPADASRGEGLERLPPVRRLQSGRNPPQVPPVRDQPRGAALLQDPDLSVLHDPPGRRSGRDPGRRPAPGPLPARGGHVPEADGHPAPRARGPHAPAPAGPSLESVS